MKISEILKDRIVVFDGAMGTMLINKGYDIGKNSSIYNITHPEIIQRIHEEYAQSGADILTANTFSANPYKLNGNEISYEKVIEKGISLAKKASSNIPVALDIGPIGKLLEPCGNLSFEEAYDVYSKVVKVGVSSGADLILIETMTDLYEAKAAVLAAKENSKLPIFCTMSFDKNGRTLTGTTPLTMTMVLQGLGVDALGINCSFGPVEILPLAEEILKYSKVPIILQPNAGIPINFQGNIYYDVSKEKFAEYAKMFAQKGIRILGGCCGTTPSYIKCIKESVNSLPILKTFPKKITSATDGSNTVIFGEDTIIVGERINPSGRDDIKDAMIKGNYDFITADAIRQKNAGAKIIDINVGIPGIDECSVLKNIVKKIQKSVDIPLQIDSTNPKAIEGALRIYNGRAIINSVNGDDEIMEAIFPIVKKYGASVIGLTFDKGGIPNTAEKRMKIAEKIINKAKQYEMDEEDILIDCLVLTAATSKNNFRECLRMLKMVRNKYDAKTILGISNVSYGLPNREAINSSFFSIALYNGLNSAIINPLSRTMMDAFYSYRLLCGKDDGANDYINHFRNDEKKVNNDINSMELEELIILGLKEEGLKRLKKLISDKSDYDDISECFINALEKCGKLYDEGKMFLTELMRCAETVNYLNEYLVQTNRQVNYKGKIILASVEGDIHDTGKNMAKMLLMNYGYEVIDMGTDVSTELIINKIKEENVKLLGLSAIMTTTIKNMEMTIKKIKKEYIGCKIMVGGSVLNKSYAQEIGADYYAPNARDSIHIAQEVFG